VAEISKAKRRRVNAEVGQQEGSRDGVLAPALFRAVNDRIRELLDENVSVDARASDLRDFICECRRRDCFSSVSATVAEFDAIRAGENLFLVDPNHAEEPERLVRKTPRFGIVELRPPAAHPAQSRRPATTPQRV
jgi:hypothetical protein